jgi:hypothetical protein
VRVDGRSKHPLWGVWHAMMGRCYYPSTTKYSYYGGRGIGVCERWRDFWSFVEDMSPRPDGHFLDRIDNNLGYSLQNCRWATKDTHHNNKRDAVILEWKGRSMTIAQWSRELSIHPKTIGLRIARGWCIEDALGAPLMRGRRKDIRLVNRGAQQ